MKVGVFGAGSNTGLELLDKLSREGHHPIAYIHNTIPQVKSTCTLTPSATYIFEHCDHIISLIPICTFAEILNEHLTPHHVINQIICLSSASIFVKAQSEVDWEVSKAAEFERGEQLIVGLCNKSNITYTILRPSMIWGNMKDKNVTFLLTLVARFGFILLPAQGVGLRYPLHASQLADVIIKTLTNAFELCPNQAYIVLGPEPITYHDLVSRLFLWIELTPIIVRVPARLVKTLIKCLNLVLQRPDLNFQSVSRIDQSYDYSKNSYVISASGSFKPLSRSDYPRPKALIKAANSIFATLSP